MPAGVEEDKEEGRSAELSRLDEVWLIRETKVVDAAPTDICYSTSRNKQWRKEEDDTSDRQPIVFQVVSI